MILNIDIDIVEDFGHEVRMGCDRYQHVVLHGRRPTCQGRPRKKAHGKMRSWAV